MPLIHHVLPLSNGQFLNRTSPSQISMSNSFPAFHHCPLHCMNHCPVSSESHPPHDGAIDAMTAAVNPRGMQPSEMRDPATFGPPSPPYSSYYTLLPAPARHTECHDVNLKSKTASKPKLFGRVTGSQDDGGRHGKGRSVGSKRFKYCSLLALSASTGL